MPRLTDRVRKLELEISRLKDKIADLSKNTEETTIRPYSKSGGVKDPSQVRPSDIETGLGATFGGNLIFNDAELQFPPYGQQPTDPTKGYNKHGHSRYAGGALDIHTLELVEYETEEDEENENYEKIIDPSGNPLNKHCQQFWKVKPNIKKDGEVPKIGLLDIEFDPSVKKWVAGANFVDVERTYLVRYIYKDPDTGVEVDPDTEGAVREVRLDSKGNEMKAPLAQFTKAPSGESESERIARENANLDKSIVTWDENSQTWKFYAVFKPAPEEEEEE